MKSRLEFSCAYFIASGSVVSVTPLQKTKGAKMMGFSVSHIVIFHVEGPRIVPDMNIPTHETKAFERQLDVTVETEKPIKRVEGYMSPNGPAEMFFAGTGRDIAFYIHRDIAQLTEVSLEKRTILPLDREPEISLMMTAHIGLLDETLTVSVARYEDNVTNIINAYAPEFVSCQTKAQLVACIEKLQAAVDLRDTLRLRWDMDSCETIYRHYQEETSVTFR